MIVHWSLLGLLRSFLPPANKVCEGNVFTGVCLSTGGGMHGWGTCVAEGHAWQGVCMVGACMPGGMHGRGCAWQRGVHGGGICDRRHSWLGVCGVAGEMATAVGGTHPTGMHSCLLLKMVYFL